jgi:hypothetical protein
MNDLCPVCKEQNKEVQIQILNYEGSLRVNEVAILKSIKYAHRKCMSSLFGILSFDVVLKSGSANCYDCQNQCEQHCLYFAEIANNKIRSARFHKECIVSLGGEEALKLLTDLKQSDRTA